MKTTTMVAGLTLATILVGSAHAQEVPPNGPFGGVPNERGQAMRERAGDRVGFFRGGSGTGNEMLFRVIQDPQMAKEIGLADENAQALKDAFLKIQEKQIDLQAELAKLNLQQTGQVASLLAERGKNPDEALDLLEEIGKINVKISKLAVQRILAIRENMTDEQIAKAREGATKRMEQMRTAVRNRGAEAGGAGGAGNVRRTREGGAGGAGGAGEGRRPREGGER